MLKGKNVLEMLNALYRQKTLTRLLTLCRAEHMYPYRGPFMA